MENNLKIAIVDDESISLEMISSIIITTFEKFSQPIVADKFVSALDFKKMLSEKTYDLVFLDIDMPEIDGIELAKTLKETKNPPTIIFVSNREERVFDSFIVNPFGFVRKSNLLKDIPLVIESFTKKINSAPKDKVVEFVTKRKMYSIPLDQILYFESFKDYQNVYRKDKNEIITLNLTMDDLEKKLKDNGFIRIHKSFLVNHSAIEKIDGLHVILVTHKKLPIGRRRLQEVKETYLKLLHAHESIIIGN